MDEPCWEDSGSVCAWVHDRTGGNETLARLVDWLIDRPLQILIVLVVALLLVRFARRWVGRTVRRVINPDRQAAARHLRRIGVPPPSSLVTDVRDPRRETRASVTAAAVSGALAVLIWTIATIMIVGIVGLDLGPLIAGAGIAGLAIGFGAQSLVKDWIAGLFVLFEDHYGIGDAVDLGEASGVVEHFSLRATTLRSLDGTVWHVPNGMVTRAGNLSQNWSVALLDIEVSYTSDLEAVQTLLHQVADRVCRSEQFAPHVLESPEVMGIEQLTPNGIVVRLKVKTVAGQQWALQRALRFEIKQAFERAGGIEEAPPARTVWMHLDAPHDAPTDPAAPTQPEDEPS